MKNSIPGLCQARQYLKYAQAGCPRAEARLALEFAVEAMDGDTMVAMGGHTRVVVERERFLARLD